MSTELMTAEYLMEIVRDGDEHGWQTELRWLWTHHRDRLLALMDDVLAEGFLAPVQIGPDGRLWDGHHRVAVAAALGIMLPTERLPEPDEAVVDAIDNAAEIGMLSPADRHQALVAAGGAQ